MADPAAAAAAATAAAAAAPSVTTVSGRKRAAPQPAAARPPLRHSPFHVFPPPLAPPPPPPPFRGPAADSPAGEKLLDALPFVAAVGYAADVSQAAQLCGTTWRPGSKGAVGDMIKQSLRLQVPDGGFAAARARPREDFAHPARPREVHARTTQLMRSAALNNVRGVRVLVALGAKPELRDSRGWAALHWASEMGYEHVVAELLKPKLIGARVDIDAVDFENRSALSLACDANQEAAARALIAGGATDKCAGPNGLSPLAYASKAGN